MSERWHYKIYLDPDQYNYLEIEIRANALELHKDVRTKVFAVIDAVQALGPGEPE